MGPRPDVLLVVADDLGYGDLSCYGADAFTTPALDSLAASGRRYTDAHAASSVCTPSRYALLTGRYPWRTPLRSRVLGGTDGALIGSSTPTIANCLRASGYRTAAFGKWHLGLDWTLRDGSRRQIEEGTVFHSAMEADGWDVDYSADFENGPSDRGFDEFFGIAGSLDMPPYCFLRDRRVESLPTDEKTNLVASQRPGPVAPGWQDDQVDLRFLEEAEAWLERTAPMTEDDPPRFIYFATSAPHRPCVPPAPFAGASGIGARADCVLLVDAIVDRLVTMLTRGGRPSLILFTSDNGAPTIFQDDGRAQDHPANGPWRGQKADVYDGGHRVPLIAAGTGITPGTDDRLVSLLDILPSLIDHLAAPLTVEPQGGGFAPVASPSRSRRGEGFSVTGNPGARVDGSPLLFNPTGRGDRDADRVLGATAFDGSLVLMREADTAVFSTGSGGFSEPVGEPTSLNGDTGQFYDRRADPGQQQDLWKHPQSPRRSLINDFISSTDYRETR